MNVTFKPTNEILRLCEIVDNAIGRFIELRSKCVWGKYEYEVSADINLIQTIRHLESIIELARKDLVYIQSALVLARTTFEGLIRTSWMLFPDDKFICETRYSAYLQTEIEYLEKVARIMSDNTKVLKKKEQVHLFKEKLDKLLVEKGYKNVRLPNFREMLKEIDEEKKYLYYIMLSQYSHYSHTASAIYQRNLGSAKILSEEPREDLWRFVFATTFPAFRLTSTFFLSSIGVNEDLFDASEILEFEKIVVKN